MDLVATSVTVSDVKRSSGGHTLYLVTLTERCSVSGDNETDEPKQTCVWRRYSAILRLRRQLHALLQQLQASAELPQLPKPKYFGRFDASVIEERRLACELLLAFVSGVQLIVNSTVFRGFFNEESLGLQSSAVAPGSGDDFDGSDSFLPALISPAQVGRPVFALGRAGSCSSVDSLPDLPDIADNEYLRTLTPEYALPEGIAGQLDDSSSLSDQIDGGCGSGGTVSPRTLTPEYALAEGIPGQLDDSSSLSDQIDGSGGGGGDTVSPPKQTPSGSDLLAADCIWLNRAPSPLGDSNESEDAGQQRPFDEAGDPVDKADEQLEGALLDLSVLSGEAVRASAVSDESGESDEEDETLGSCAGGVESAADKENGDAPMASLDIGVSLESIDPSQPAAGRPTRLDIQLASERKVPAELVLRSTDAVANGGEEQQADVDYIVAASRLISRAISAEGKSQYDEAYNLYVSGVGVLLSGVQTDSNSFRRDAVRLKTAQYLQRAEVLQRAGDGGNTSQVGNQLREEVCQLPYRPTSDLVGKSSTAARVLSALQSPPASLSYLANIHQHSSTLKNIERPIHVGPRLLDYRVLRPVGRCMLVENKFTGDVYLIKSLVKCQSLAHNAGAKRSRCLMKYLCPYMAKPVGHFETAGGVFLLLEYVQRGCLWDHLGRFRTQPNETTGSAGQVCGVAEKQVRQWSAQLVVALSNLHLSGFVWRDLHSRNLLLSEEGTLMLTYCGDWEHIERQSSIWAAKNLYVAPELSWSEKPTPAADWWSLGVILYELLTGNSMLSWHPSGIAPHSSLRLPRDLPERSQSLLSGFLQVNPKERLGAGPTGIEEIKSHPFFSKIRGWHS